MNKTDQRVFVVTLLAVISAGLALKFGRSLPVIGDAADGFGA